MLKAGYAQRDITPDLAQPVYLAGFAPNRRATSVHDNLWVRALALQHDETILVLIGVDAFGLNRDFCQKIEREVQLQTKTIAKVVISSSHSHYTPDVVGLWGPSPTVSGVDRDYMGSLNIIMRDTATQAICDLWEKPTAVGLKSAATVVNGVAKNYRDPAITDEEATCLQFLKADHTIFATLIIFPCHPQVLETTSTAISADYIYTLREKIEIETNAPAIFMPGSLGGMMAPAMPGRTHEDAAHMGHIIAKTALAALAIAPIEPNPLLDYQRAEISIPMQNELFIQAIQMRLLPNRLDVENNTATEVGLIKIGGTWLTTMPGEVLPKVGLDLKSDMLQLGAQVAGVMGLANDELGYILAKEDFIFPTDWFNPGRQYEESVSPGPDTAPLLMEALHTLF